MDYDKILLVADWTFHGALGVLVGLLYFALIWLIILIPISLIALIIKKL
jgi:hypothetical protein